jgi:hypothetical protein
MAELVGILPQLMLQIVKVNIATEAGWRYDAARHRLPSKLFKHDR